MVFFFSHRLQVASLQGEKTDLLAKVEISVQELSKQQQFIEEQNKQVNKKWVGVARVFVWVEVCMQFM